jgi:hypothetical protein
MQTSVPCPGRFDAHLAARLLGEAVHHRQAQAGALPHRLGGEEGIEGARQHVRRHAGAVVAHRTARIRPAQVAIAARLRPIQRLPVSISMRPPSGMASRALLARFSSALSSWFGSHSVVHRRRLQRVSSAIAGPAVRFDQVESSTSPARSRWSAWARAPGAARRPAGGASAPPRAGSRRARRRCAPAGRRSGPCAGAASSARGWPVTPASMLLKSCARPPVSWPTASIFCDWRSDQRQAHQAALAHVVGRAALEHLDRVVLADHARHEDEGHARALGRASASACSPEKPGSS